ncbi:putative amino-acid metabolite efflux pump [Oxobacter pfennigii]|uniref:Putative amino-acid metabolite efflux pump n=1 Tax=Oxobacter pfennigii TaxID=36849 RepID=A0A0P8W696_9CLOT|nr:DMT family transporter [Oxobacter pfennigii]KPU44217.1 putative amino-acid metabolite efflux pump [Oxobacter pfennigii]
MEQQIARQKEKTIYLLMTLSTLFWSGAFIAGKFSVKEFPPFTLTFLRFFIASAIIFIIMIKVEKEWKITLKDVPVFLTLGIVGMFGYHVMFFMALKYTSAINSSLIAATNPLMTAILASFFLGDKMSYKKIGPVLLSLSGVALTITGGNFKEVVQAGLNIGDLFMLAAVFLWAAYSVLSKKIGGKYSPIVLTAYSFISCSIILIPFVIWENPASFIPSSTISGWTAVFYMAIFPSVIGYLVQQHSIKIIGARRTMIFVNLVPVFSIILSLLILKETLSPFKLLSSLLIIVGVYFTNRLGN